MTGTPLTLSPRFNAILLVAWVLAAGALLWIVRPHPVLLASIGAAAGLSTGVLQRKSVRSAPATFVGAQSTLEVRRAFMSNRPGRLSIAMTWITGLVLLAIALIQGGNVLLGFAAGYASFMFVREAVALGALSRARRNVGHSPRAF